MSSDLRDALTADLARLLEANRALDERTRRLTRGLSLLARIAGLARSGDDRRATACAVLTGVTAGVGLGMNRALVLVPTDAGDELEVLAAIGPLDRTEADRVWRSIERDGPDLETLYEVGARTLSDGSALANTIVGARLTRDARRIDGSGARFELDGPTAIEAPLPMSARSGSLVADNVFTGRAPDDETRLLFSLVASLAGPALEAAARFERVSAQATTDPLTGLASRRTGDAILRETCDAALLDGRAVTLVLLDLDDFKRINDTLGHPAGDAVLREIGARLRARLPPRTRAYRYGGEELAIVSDALSEADAIGLAHTLHDAVRAQPVAQPHGPLAVTTSVGLAHARGIGADSLLARADEALLAAKRAGKDRVVVAA